MLLTSPIWGGRFRPFPVYLLSSLASAQGGSHHIRHWHPAMWDAGGRASELQPLRMIAHTGEDSFWLTIPSLLWLAELMAHKHTWLHKGGETDWWSDSVAPGGCTFNKLFPYRSKTKCFYKRIHFLKSTWHSGYVKIKLHQFGSCRYRWGEPWGCRSHEGAKCLQCSRETVLTSENSIDVM